MRHRKHTFRVGRKPAHRHSMLANMACSLIAEGRITTTVVKAKEVRRLTEKMITLGKRGDLHSRRLAIAKLQQPIVVRHLFEVIAPDFQNRDGGYTRIIRLGTRRGDAAEMCIIELLGSVGSAVDNRTTVDVGATELVPVATATTSTDDDATLSPEADADDDSKQDS